MAGRTYEEVTSGFKPLSLDEIMAVPLAKQAQQDASQLYFDDLQLLEENALASDKDYVQGQVGALKDEATSLSDQMMESGVDRGFMNKVKGLRTRKNREFSASGKTGKANAAYNEFQTNKQNIMNRKDLSDAQKRAGMQRAQDNYTGVEAGGIYEEYIGTAQVDLMDKGRKIVAQMTPVERASALGMSYDEQTGIYSRGSYETRQLEPADMQRIVYSALKNDQGVADYLSEVDSLGIGDSEQMLITASQSAGQVGNVDVYKETFTPLPKEFQAYGQQNGGGDLRERWTSNRLYVGEGLWGNKFKVMSEDDSYRVFNSEGKIDKTKLGFDPSVQKAQEESQAYLDFELNRTKVVNGKTVPFHNWRWRSDKQWFHDQKFKTIDKISNEVNDLEVTVSKLRELYPALKGNKPGTAIPAVGTPGSRGYIPAVGATPYTDKDIYEIYASGATRAQDSYGIGIEPANPNNLFYKVGERIVGSLESPGSFGQKNMKIAGFPGGGKDVIAEHLDMDLDDFTDMVATSGRLIGFAPGHVDMPGAYAVQVKMDDGSTPIIYMENDSDAKGILEPVSWMNKAIQDVEPITTYKRLTPSGKIRYDHVITELDPNTRNFEAFIVRTKGDYKKEDIDKMKFVFDPETNVQRAVDDQGIPIVPNVVKRDYNQEMQNGINQITRRYDETPGTTTTKSQVIKANK